MSSVRGYRAQFYKVIVFYLIGKNEDTVVLTQAKLLDLLPLHGDTVSYNHAFVEAMQTKRNGNV